MALYREQAVVLRTIKLGEADRIVNLMTRHKGKVRAVVKGVRKTKSRFGGRLEPSRHVALQLYEGRELDTVTQAETLDHFSKVRDDLDRLTKAMVLLEAVDLVAQEHQADPGLYRILVGGLRALNERDRPLLAAAFLLRVLAHEGLQPLLDLDRLPPSDFALFDLDEGVVEPGGGLGFEVSWRAVELMAQVVGGQMGDALNEPESAVTREVDQLVTRMFEHHMERGLRSVSVREAP